MKTFSIIIPIYKLLYKSNLKFFENLILCISNNLNKTSLISDLIKEIIIVNDYPDEDIENEVSIIFKQFYLTEKLIIINNKENYGQAKSRNIGAEKASGEYLHFIDQDDFINKEFYQSLLQYNADILISNPKIYLDYKQLKYNYFKNRALRKYRKAKCINDLFIFLTSNIMISPGQYLIKKSIYNEVNGFPDLKNKGSDDFGFVFKLSIINIDVKFIETATYFHRLHEFQGKNTLNLRKSVSEYLDNIEQDSLNKKMKLIKRLREMYYISKIIGYVIFGYYFNRVK